MRRYHHEKQFLARHSRKTSLLCCVAPPVLTSLEKERVIINTDINGDTVTLTNLTRVVDAMEQQSATATKEVQQAEAHKFLSDVLSDQLIFRRADCTVVTKAMYAANLTHDDRFIERQSENIAVHFVGNRALVTSFVVTKTKEGKEGRYRNVRLWCRSGNSWTIDLWYNYDVTSL
jgi:hypothetical protein